MSHRVLFTLISLLFISYFGYSQEVIDSISTPMSSQVEEVNIYAQKAAKTSVVSLSRKQFLTMAGALEDPTRLLIKYPGISTHNDQSNSVIYHGMPSHYHKWSLYGARILNPNHLGNAGTISDLPSRSAGGVNMFSGQVIGSLDFYGNPSENSLDAIAANSNIKLRDTHKNGLTSNLSLIGVELGLDQVYNEGNSNLLLNYRYSTVGLLTSMGLDFGGEIINYQDFTGKYSFSTKKGYDHSVYLTVGKDSNSKGAIHKDSIPLEFVDLKDIEYNSFNVTGGFSVRRKMRNYTFENTINISHVDTERKSLFSFLDQDNKSIYANKETLISMLTNYSRTMDKLQTGLTMSTEWHDINMKILSPGIIIPSQNYSYFNLPFFQITPIYNISYNPYNHWVFDGNLGVKISHNRLIKSKNVDSHLIGNFSVEYSKGKFNSSITTSRSTQIYAPEILLLDYSTTDDNWIYSSNVEWNIQYNGLHSSLFYHHISDIPVSRDKFGFSGFDNINTPSTSDLGEDYVVVEEGQANVYGVSLGLDKTLGKINISSNITLMESKHTIGSQTTKAPLNFGHIFNIRASREWDMNQDKKIGLSASFHHRGGGYQSRVSPDLSLDWGYTHYSYEDQYSVRLTTFYRADMRIYYKPSKRSTISLDIQNVTNRENDAHYYYEPLTGKSELKKQLGLIPILSWRMDW